MFRVVYKQKKKAKPAANIHTIDMVDGNGTLVAKNGTLVAGNGTLVSGHGTLVASNGTLLHTKPKSVMSSQSGGATLIPATVVVPHGSTLSVDKASKNRRLPSDSSSQRVIYNGSHVGTKTRTTSRTGHRQQHRAHSSSSYAYGTTGNGVHYSSNQEIGALVLSGDVKSGKLKVLGEMPRERRVRKWLHRQHAGGVTRSASNDALDADHRSLPSDVFESSTGDEAGNALKLRWSPWMDRKTGGRKVSESESYVDQRTLPAYYERKYIYPQYTGKAMSSL